MATITYKDLGGDAPRVTWNGIKFLDGVPVFVEDAHVIAKAKQNPFFEVDETAKEALKALAPAFEAEPKPVDVDDEKDALVKEAEALGIDVDRRWGVKRLEQEISEAKIRALD